jgi:hypothetical protein
MLGPGPGLNPDPQSITIIGRERVPVPVPVQCSVPVCIRGSRFFLVFQFLTTELGLEIEF